MELLTFEEQQKFLRSLLTEVVIFEEKVQIKGVILREPVVRDTSVSLRPDDTDSTDWKGQSVHHVTFL